MRVKKNKTMLNRLQGLEEKVKKSKNDNDIVSKVIDSMKTEDLREIVNLFEMENQETAQAKIEEIWRRAENEYKNNITKKARSR